MSIIKIYNAGKYTEHGAWEMHGCREKQDIIVLPQYTSDSLFQRHRR